MINIFVLVCSSLLCCMCTSVFSSDAGKLHSGSMVHSGRVGNEDLKAVLKRTEAIRLESVDLLSPSKSWSESVGAEQAGRIVEMLGEDCRAVDPARLNGDIDFFRQPSDLVFLDIHGKEVGRLSLGRIGAASVAEDGRNCLEDMVLPDEEYNELIELLRYADIGTNRSIRVWLSQGKAEFEYAGVRFSSLEQLKKRADLKNDFIVHLMQKVTSDEVLKLYKEMAGMGFKVEDMTAPFSNGPRGRALPEIFRN